MEHAPVIAGLLAEREEIAELERQIRRHQAEIAVSRSKIQDIVGNYNKPTVFMVLAICADSRFAGGVGQTTKTYLVRGWDSGTDGYTDIDVSRIEIPESEIRLQKLPF